MSASLGNLRASSHEQLLPVAGEMGGDRPCIAENRLTSCQCMEVFPGAVFLSPKLLRLAVTTLVLFVFVPWESVGLR